LRAFSFFGAAVMSTPWYVTTIGRRSRRAISIAGGALVPKCAWMTVGWCAAIAVIHRRERTPVVLSRKRERPGIAL
jgi:hypothetical protein